MPRKLAPKNPQTISRLALDPTVRHLIDAVQDKTRAPSPSAAISLLVTRYAPHLLASWDSPHGGAVAELPLPLSLPAPPPADFAFTSPLEF